MARKKLLLVNPVNTVRSGFSVNPTSRFPPLGLGILASLTPDTWDVELVDENFSAFDHRDADLVGLTAFTSAANRAYEIAQSYRQKNIPVVMGGIHASMCSTEALQFADAVVVGEVESVWQRVLADFEQGRVTGLYQGAWLDSQHLALPRRDIYSADYMFASVQTSRGCPLDCDFCSVTAYNGRRYRRRDVTEVLDEMEAIPNDLLFFVDDNILGYGSANRAQALELFQGMVARDIRKHWFCQASINVGDDQELLEWAGRAGCRMIFIGIEAEDSEALAEVNKRLNLKKGSAAYAQAFDRIHAAGIAVLGAFIFGMDSDTPHSLRRRAQFMIESGVDAMQLTTMTPLPGTQLFKRFQQEGRLLYTDFPRDWANYDLTKLVHQPKTMSPETLWEVIQECTETVYAPHVIKEKARCTLQATRSFETTEFAYRTNTNYRNIGLALGTLN